MLGFSALSDPTRLQIVEMLAENGPMPASRIGAGFAISAPAVSQHLKVLKASGLVTMEVRAQQRIYTLNPDSFADIEHWLSRMRRLWTARFDALDSLVINEHRKSGKTKGPES